MRNMRISLSPVDRASVRKAIARHPDWPAHSRAKGINTADLSKELLFTVADALGLDVQHILADARAAAKAAGNAAFANAGASFAPAASASAPVAGGVTRSEARKIAREEIDFYMQPREIKVVVVDDGITTRALPAGTVTHPQYSKLVAACIARDFKGFRLNPLLVGPTGTGKSFACEQVADQLELAFYFHSVATEAYDLVGYVDVRGVYQTTQFVQAFEHGGVCLLDEMDRYDAKALVALNAALASAKMSLPDGRTIARHPDFICVGAANTFGLGATAQFVAAEPLDASTRSRFQVKLDWHVDEETENAIAASRAGNPSTAAAWIAEIRAVRAAAAQMGLDLILDQRVIEAGSALLTAGLPPVEVRNLTYLAGLDDDQKNGIVDKCFSSLCR